MQENINISTTEASQNRSKTRAVKVIAGLAVAAAAVGILSESSKQFLTSQENPTTAPVVATSHANYPGIERIPNVPIGEGEQLPNQPIGSGEQLANPPLGSGEQLPNVPVGEGEQLPNQPIGSGEIIPNPPLGSGEQLPNVPIGEGEQLPNQPIGAGETLPNYPVDLPHAS